LLQQSKNFVRNSKIVAAISELLQQFGNCGKNFGIFAAISRLLPKLWDCCTNVRISVKRGVARRNTRRYTAAGQLASEQHSMNGVSAVFTSSYVYDLDGRLRTIAYPSGRVVQRSYQSSGSTGVDRINSILDDTTSSTAVYSVQDNPAGQITGRNLAGGSLAETRSYNSRNQLTGIAALQAGATTLMNLAYSYTDPNLTDNVGRIRSRTDSVQGNQSVSYTYDSLYRLTGVTNSTVSWSVQWTYDNFGNRTSQTPTGTSAVASQSLGYSNNQLLISCPGYPNNSCYDASGNLLNDGLHNYTYDAESRMKLVDGGAVQFAYDGDGRRVEKTVNGTTTYYIYGVTGLMSEFTTVDTGATQAASTDSLQYRVSEQTGTAVLITDAAGNAVENNRVLPFGEPWQLNSNSTNDQKFTTYDRGAAGQSDSELDYAMARFYGNRYGRFTSPDRTMLGADPRNPQSWNKYTYAGNDPINFIDPSGLKCVTLDNGTVVDDDTEPLCDSDKFDQSTTNVDVTIRPDPNNWEFLQFWLSGDLPSAIFYGQNDPATQEMRISPLVQLRRSTYVAQGCPATGQLNGGHFEAYATSFFVPKGIGTDVLGGGAIPAMNQTAVQVGGFTGTIKRNGSIVTYTITNTAGNSSFLGESTWGPLLGMKGTAWDNPNGPTGPRHNVVQTFQWTEANPCQN
jgi:RHS repeat-associated protein